MNALDPRSRDLVIRTVLGEAGQEPSIGKAGVAAVIRNRTQLGKWGADPAQVVLARNQFEPWARPDARRRMLAYTAEDPAYMEAADIVDRVFAGELEDPTQGATHFYSPSAQTALGRRPPSWDDGSGQDIGRHRFLAPEGRVQVASNNGLPPGFVLDDMPGSPTPTPAFSATGAPGWQDGSVQSAPLTDLPPGFVLDEGEGEGGEDQALLSELSQMTQQAGTPQVSQGAAFVEGALSGASANLRDEIYGLSEASGLPGFLGGLRTGAGAMRVGAEALLPSVFGTSATERYEGGRDRARNIQRAAQEQNPLTYLGGNVAGAIALPGGAAMQGATRTAQAARGAAVGAGYGGAYGFGEGEGIEDRLGRAATGATFGGLAGAAAPYLIDGAAAVGRGVSSVANRLTGPIRAAINPEREAARRVGTVLSQDAASGSTAMTPGMAASAERSGQPLTAMDLGGETTRALARSAANTSPEARAVLDRTLNDRFESQSERVGEFLRGLIPTPGNATMTREALEEAAARSRKPFYDRAYKEGADGLWDAGLEQMATTSPLMESAMKKAAASVGNKQASGRAMNPLSPSGKPTLEYWDQVKRTLDSDYNIAKRAGDREGMADIQGLKTELVRRLDEAFPSYATARGVSAELFKADNALEAGEKFVTSTMKNADAKRALARMTAEERALFQEGFVSRLIARMDEGADRRSVLNQIAQSPAARERIELALGKDKAAELETFLRVEGIMNLARSAVQGNSTTARQLVEMGLAGGAYGASQGGLVSPETFFYSMLGAAFGKGKMRIDANVSRRVGEMLASTDAATVQRAIKLVSSRPKWVEALRSFDIQIAKVTGQQAGVTTPLIQLPVSPRAEGEQPEIPRPKQ